MKPPSTALLRAFSPLWQAQIASWTAQSCVFQQSCAAFSSTQQRQKRNKGAVKKDRRITEIRYHLQHPLTPRPLRFSRTRALRHWTIARAWSLHQMHIRRAREAELLKQYQSMYNACEALRLIDNQGMTADDRAKLGEPPEEGKEMGRLYRIAMQKVGTWDGVPIEYARIQTDSPSREGWHSEWTR